MKPDILERIKEYLSNFKAVEIEELFEYFRNSNDFTLHSKNRGLDITSNNDNVVYVNAELNERNTYIEYIAYNQFLKLIRSIIRLDW